MKLRIGSRGSPLAITQTQWVSARLKEKNPALEIEFKEITTAGDRGQTNGKGVFVKEIEDALLTKQIDLAVHSLKDMPSNLPLGLLLGPFPKREDFRDAVVSRFGELLGELPRHSTIGTSSPRRHAQIAHLFRKREYNIQPIRGNVDTRLKKLQQGDFDSIVLAAAGLKRLGLEADVTHILDPSVFLPSPAQGCLGLEVRDDSADVLALLESIKDSDATITASAERAFLQGLGGDCNVPVGAYSSIQGDTLVMKAAIFDLKGERAVRVEQVGPVSEPLFVGYQLAGRLLQEGGAELMP